MSSSKFGVFEEGYYRLINREIGVICRVLPDDFKAPLKGYIPAFVSEVAWKRDGASTVSSQYSLVERLTAEEVNELELVRDRRPRRAQDQRPVSKPKLGDQ